VEGLFGGSGLGDNGGAERGSVGFLDQGERTAEHIGEDLAPTRDSAATFR
jgi:hypothetical protein